jgi:hypothetical protein
MQPQNHALVLGKSHRLPPCRCAPYFGEKPFCFITLPDFPEVGPVLD